LTSFSDRQVWQSRPNKKTSPRPKKGQKTRFMCDI